MALMLTLPNELENIVMDYKREFERHERKQQAINALVSEKLIQLGYPPENESVEH